MSGGMESMAEDERASKPKNGATENPRDRLIYEALYFLPRGEHRHALEVALAERERYRKALSGISGCATVGAEDCARVARMVLNNEFALSAFTQNNEQTEREPFKVQGDVDPFSIQDGE